MRECPMFIFLCDIYVYIYIYTMCILSPVMVYGLSHNMQDVLYCIALHCIVDFRNKLHYMMI